MTENTENFDRWFGPITAQFQQNGFGFFDYKIDTADIFSTRVYDKDHGPTRTAYHSVIKDIKAFKACEDPILIILDIQYRDGVPDQTKEIEMHLGNRLWYKGGFLYKPQTDPKQCEIIPNGQGRLVDLLTGETKIGLFEKGIFIEGKTNVSERQTDPSTSANTQSHTPTQNGTSSSTDGLPRKTQDAYNSQPHTDHPRIVTKRKQRRTSFPTKKTTPPAPPKKNKHKEHITSEASPLSTGKKQRRRYSQFNRTTQAPSSSHIPHGKTAKFKRRKTTQYKDSTSWNIDLSKDGASNGASKSNTSLDKTLPPKKRKVSTKGKTTTESSRELPPAQSPMALDARLLLNMREQ